MFTFVSSIFFVDLPSARIAAEVFLIQNVHSAGHASCKLVCDKLLVQNLRTAKRVCALVALLVAVRVPWPFRPTIRSRWVAVSAEQVPLNPSLLMVWVSTLQTIRRCTPCAVAIIWHASRTFRNAAEAMRPVNSFSSPISSMPLWIPSRLVRSPKRNTAVPKRSTCTARSHAGRVACFKTKGFAECKAFSFRCKKEVPHETPPPFA